MLQQLMYRIINVRWGFILYKDYWIQTLPLLKLQNHKSSVHILSSTLTWKIKFPKKNNTMMKTTVMQQTPNS